MSGAERLAEELRRTLAADHVTVEDESVLHRGHAGAEEGGHFDVVIVASRFEDLDPIARHRVVYEALGDLAAHGIHALALRTYTRAEWRRAGGSDPR